MHTKINQTRNSHCLFVEVIYQFAIIFSRFPLPSQLHVCAVNWLWSEEFPTFCWNLWRSQTLWPFYSIRISCKKKKHSLFLLKTLIKWKTNSQENFNLKDTPVMLTFVIHLIFNLACAFDLWFGLCIWSWICIKCIKNLPIVAFWTLSIDHMSIWKTNIIESINY